MSPASDPEARLKATERPPGGSSRSVSTDLAFWAVVFVSLLSTGQAWLLVVCAPAALLYFALRIRPTSRAPQPNGPDPRTRPIQRTPSAPWRPLENRSALDAYQWADEVEADPAAPEIPHLEAIPVLGPDETADGRRTDVNGLS